jgi:hypothetical protein
VICSAEENSLRYSEYFGSCTTSKSNARVGTFKLHLPFIDNDSIVHLRLVDRE